MSMLALPVALAAAVTVPATRSFWRPVPSGGVQPAQIRVEATLLAQGRRVAVYQQQGYSPAASPEVVAHTVSLLENEVMPKLEATFGEFPDRDANGRVLLLVCEGPTLAADVFAVDLGSEEDANRRGLHSNEGEVIYHPFAYSGNRSALNVFTVAEAAYRLLHLARHPDQPGVSRWLAAYMPFFLGQTSPRWLWGDTDPLGYSLLPHDPWDVRGWSLLLLHYLYERQGEAALAALQRQFSLATLTAPNHQSDLLGDFAMACWLDERGLADGRFGFVAVHPPRPLVAARGEASRPSSGLLQVGAGGIAHLVIEGSGERSLPLTLQGDPEARWSARAVVVSAQGPTRELEMAFGEGAVARLGLPQLQRGEAVVVAIAAHPAAAPGGDRRILPLYWGVGWVPHIAKDDAPDRLATAVQKALPDGGKAARERLAATVARLTGEDHGAPRLSTRYAYEPSAAAVVEVLSQEAARRGLRAQLMPFTHLSPAGVEQVWHNVLIELPGQDPRRWPVVLAAHWDAVRGDAEESAAQALSASDNAAGVATVLEAAGAISRRQRQSSVLVAFLAGGQHAAAGAVALLAERQGKFAAWIEVDEVGIPQRGTRAGHLWLEVPSQPFSRLPAGFVRAAKETGLVARLHSEAESSHTGTVLAAKRGIPAYTIRSRTPDEAAVDAALPLAVERQRLSYDLLALVAKALADAVTVAAGGN